MTSNSPPPAITLTGDPPLVSVCKPEVQSSVPLVGRRGNVVKSLVCCHSRPLSVAIAVTQHVVSLRRDVEDDVGAGNPQQNSVSKRIARFIPFARQPHLYPCV